MSRTCENSIRRSRGRHSQDITRTAMLALWGTKGRLVNGVADTKEAARGGCLFTLAAFGDCAPATRSS